MAQFGSRGWDIGQSPFRVARTFIGRRYQPKRFATITSPRLARRLQEVGLGDRTRDSLARELAHVAVLGRSFAERTLPLFLSMDADHKDLLHQVLISMKRDLDELGDAIHDIEMDFPALIGAFEKGEG